MSVQLIVVSDLDNETALADIISDALEEVLSNRALNLNAGLLSAAVKINYRCKNTETLYSRIVELDRDESLELDEAIIDELLTLLLDEQLITHAVRFDDNRLRAELALYADQIFTIEMKVRRALTLAYLRSPSVINPYKLLNDEKVRPARKDANVI